MSYSVGPNHHQLTLSGSKREVTRPRILDGGSLGGMQHSGSIRDGLELPGIAVADAICMAASCTGRVSRLCPSRELSQFSPNLKRCAPSEHRDIIF